MKETVKTSRTAGYLEKIFRALNADWFGGELEEPIITIQSTPRAYGHVTVAKTWKRKDDWRHELNLGAETLDRPIEHVVATIVHEMVHLYNIAHDVQDCSRSGAYHNRKFRDEAERRGLRVNLRTRGKASKISRMASNTLATSQWIVMVAQRCSKKPICHALQSKGFNRPKISLVPSCRAFRKACTPDLVKSLKVLKKKPRKSRRRPKMPENTPSPEASGAEGLTGGLVPEAALYCSLQREHS